MESSISSCKEKNRKKFLEKLKETERLRLLFGEYAIWGSGPLAIRGFREAKDIDIVVKKNLWQDLLKRFVPYDTKHIRIGNIEIWKDLINLNERMDEVIDQADVLAGHPFVSLQETLSWKKYLNREKDQQDIKMIEELLKLSPGIYQEKPFGFSPDLLSVACYLFFEDTFLFLQKAPKQWNAGKWGIPCGRVEEGENLKEAMARELQEEIGFSIEKDRLVYQRPFYVISLERVGYIFHTFFCKLDQIIPVCLSEEHKDFKWIPYGKELDFIPFQKEAFSYQMQK